MDSTTLLIGGLLTLLEGATYLIVADRLRRVAPLRHSVPWRLFAFWWAGAGLNKVIAGAAGLGATYGVIGFPAYLTVIHVSLVLLTASLFCLLAYLVYLYTGRVGGIYALAFLYGAYLLTLEWSLNASAPVAVGLGTWRTYLVNSATPPPALRLFNLGMLFIPQVLAAAAYLGLRRRLTDPTQRYRTLLVPLSILCWSASVTLVALPGFAESSLMQIGSRLVGVLAGLLTLAAYLPPAWAKQRWGVESAYVRGIVTRARG